MTFEEILPFIKDGVRVSRKNWGEYSIKSSGKFIELSNYLYNEDDWEILE